MARARNVFLKSKMNKDLDARLIQNGEYRDALNIQVSQSAGSDVGAVENIQGNESVLNFQTHTGVSNLKTIGYVVDQNSEAVFLFLTNDIASHFIIRYSQSGLADTLVQGDWLNFSSNHPMNGATVIEDLLFFTDNFNQPRKINWQSALSFNTTTSYYYTNEQQISVAKFSPYLSPRLIDLTSTATLKPSTMSDGRDLPDTTIGPITWATKNLKVTSFRNRAIIHEAQSFADWKQRILNKQPAWCYYDFDPINGEVYGKIYNRFCMQSNNVDVFGNSSGGDTIAPIGFKLPEESDFNNLLSSVSNDTDRLKSTSGSSPNTADNNFPYVPGTWVVSLADAVDYAGTEVNNEFFDSIPTGYRKANGGGVTDFINIGGDDSVNPGNFQNNAAYYWIKGAAPGAEKFIAFRGSNTAIGPSLAPAPTSNDYVGYYIRCIREDDYDGWNGDPDYLREKFVRFSYRFKFDDNEYSLVAPFTQAAFIPNQGGLFFEGDGEKTFRSTIVDFMQNNVNNFVLNIPLPSGSINKDYKVKEIDILIKESDGLAFKVLESIDVDSSFDALYTSRIATTNAIGSATSSAITIDSENGIIPGYVITSINGVAVTPPAKVISITVDSSQNPPYYTLQLDKDVSYSDGNLVELSYTPDPVYQYNYQSLKPYRTLPEREVVRVYDKVPVRALAQESSGNRVMYGNFVANHAGLLNLDYKISIDEKSPQEDVEYPNHNIKQNRNYKVGIILADKWGRQSDVILSSYDNLLDKFGQPEEGSNIFHGYKRDNFQPSISSWEGDNLRITFNTLIPEAVNYNGNAGYPGAYATSSFYTTPYNGATPTAPLRYFEEVSQNANNTWTYRASNLFTGWSQTTAEEYFNNTKYLRGYYNDYVEVISTSWDSTTDPSLPALTMVMQGRIDDDYLFEYRYNQGGVFVDTLLAERTRATYVINELGFYSYRVVVQQKQQDYYNVYLPGVINGYPIVNNEDERNDTAHVVLISDNINKIPRDLGSVGPTQTEFNSSIQLFGRVTNSNDAAKKNVQYYPSLTPDTVVLISDQRTLFGPIPDYTNTSNGAPNGNCLYPGFPINYFENVVNPQSTGGITIAVENQITNSNPLIGRISTQNGIGEVESTFIPGSPYPNSMYLAVYETQAVESVLDIFWESSTTGLISDLNQDLLSTTATPVGFTSGTQISVNEGMTPGTQISTLFFPINSAGNNVLNTIGTLTSVFSKNPLGDLNTNVNRNEEFSLNSNPDGSYSLSLFSPQVALQDVETAEYYQFNIELEVESGETIVLSLEATLQNQAPSFVSNCHDLNNCNFCIGPCFDDVDYFVQSVSEASNYIMGPQISCTDPSIPPPFLQAINGSADPNRNGQQLFFEIINATKEPTGDGQCTGGVPEFIQNADTPVAERTFDIQEYSQYNEGQATISVTGFQPLTPNFFYKIQVRVTDRSDSEAFGDGMSTETIIAFTPEAVSYLNQIVWAGYQGVQLDNNIAPPNYDGPVFNALDPTFQSLPTQNQASKVGAVANWTATTVWAWLVCYNEGTNTPSTGARANITGRATAIPTSFNDPSGVPLVGPPFCAAGGFKQIFAGTAGPPLPQGPLFQLLPFVPTGPNQAPSVEAGSLIHNIELQILNFNKNGAGTMDKFLAIVFAPAGMGNAPGAGPIPSNYYSFGGQSPFLFEPVPIGIPFNANENDNYNQPGGGPFDRNSWDIDTCP